MYPRRPRAGTVKSWRLRAGQGRTYSRRESGRAHCARRARIGLSDSSQSNHRHANYLKIKWWIPLKCFYQLPGRPLLELQYFSLRCTAVPRRSYGRVSVQVFELGRDEIGYSDQCFEKLIIAELPGPKSAIDCAGRAAMFMRDSGMSMPDLIPPRPARVETPGQVTRLDNRVGCTRLAY